MFVVLYVVFFIKQKTAYEMRISDWSSYVCSSDLMMPGVGGSVAHWLAYVQALQTEKNAARTFGTGDIRGVIAPESANNSIDAGVLMPTLAFGIPGDRKSVV